jgi:hypothetical protein
LGSICTCPTRRRPEEGVPDGSQALSCRGSKQRLAFRLSNSVPLPLSCTMSRVGSFWNPSCSSLMSYLVRGFSGKYTSEKSWFLSFSKKQRTKCLKLGAAQGGSWGGESGVEGQEGAGWRVGREGRLRGPQGGQACGRKRDGQWSVRGEKLKTTVSLEFGGSG